MATTKKQPQALAIKLSRERRAGKEIPPPPKGKYSEKTRQKALRDLTVGRQRKKAAAKRKRGSAQPKEMPKRVAKKLAQVIYASRKNRRAHPAVVVSYP